MPAGAQPGVIDCLITRHDRVSRAGLGAQTPANGRTLLRQAAASLRQVDVSHDLVTDPHRRWQWPGLGLHGSVSHVDAWSVTALSTSSHVGVDVQDHRERPGALGWLGRLIGKDDPATILEFAECESLVKASELTKETFNHVRLPQWRPGWRQLDIGWWLYSIDVFNVGAVALASPHPVPIRWWAASAPRFGVLSEPQRTDCPLEGVSPWLP